MQTSTTVTLILSGISTLLIFCYGLYTLCISRKTIFPGSGQPHKMAAMVLEACYLMAKYLVGIFIVTAIIVLICEKVITTEQGLPAVTLIIGYLLGKGFGNTSTGQTSE